MLNLKIPTHCDFNGQKYVLGKSNLVRTKIQIPESPAVCTGKEKTRKAREMFEYVQHEVRHILHQMRKEGKGLEKVQMKQHFKDISFPYCDVFPSEMRDM